MKILSQLSGGLDSVASTLLIAKMSSQFSTIFYDIGQPYLKQERAASKYVVNYLKEIFNDKYLTHYDIKLPLSLSDLTDTPDEYIPVRNLVMGTHSANTAISQGFKYVAVGSKTTTIRKNDPYSFSDCSMEFYKKLGELVTFCSENQTIDFLMPLINDLSIPMSKKEVIEYLIESTIDVSQLWSCYNNGSKYCGECYHCMEIKKTGLWQYFK